MRWTTRPEHGATRLVTRFLWRPLAIGNETRWLECATWEEEWWEPGMILDGGWKKRRWITDNPDASAFFHPLFPLGTEEQEE